MGVIGNTTSPAHDLASPCLHLEHWDLIAVLYDHGVYPTLFCPPELFLSIVRINHLRHRAAHDCFMGDSLQREAEKILRYTQQHSSESWAASLPSSGTGLVLVSSIYQSAVMVYCISSLQSLGVLPDSAVSRSLMKWHKRRLGMLLKEALGSLPRRHIMTKCMTWPLVIFGMQANTEEGKYVLQELTTIAYDIGSYLPIIASSVLERFWLSGATGWDDCFHKPFIYINT